MRDKDGLFRWHPITIAYLRELVWNAYDASAFNPSWGSRREVTCKLLVVGYGESGLDPFGICCNKNGSVDIGLMQINSCHWQGTKNGWESFCKHEGLNPKYISMLFQPRINVLFAAYLNEGFIKGHHRTYSFNKNPVQRRLFSALIATTQEQVEPGNLKEARR